MQRYKYQDCLYNFIYDDARNKYDRKTGNLVVRMYLNNCGFCRIAEILNIPLSTCFMWIKKAGRIVDDIVRELKEEAQDIEILEMDELFTFIKKTRRSKKTGEWKSPHTRI